MDISKLYVADIFNDCFAVGEKSKKAFAIVKENPSTLLGDLANSPVTNFETTSLQSVIDGEGFSHHIDIYEMFWPWYEENINNLYKFKEGEQCIQVSESNCSDQKDLELDI